MTLTAKPRQCPECSSLKIRRSMPMTWRERYLFPKLFVRVYRCEGCGFRFYGFRFLKRLAAPASNFA